MRYSYTSGYANYKKAMRTYVRTSLRRRVFFHLQMWGFCLLGILLVLLMSPLAAKGSMVGLIIMPLAVGLIAGGAMPLLLRPWQLKRTYSAHNGDPKEPLAIYVEVEGDVLIDGIGGRSEGRFLRSAVCDFAEDEDFLLLFLTKRKFLYLSKKELPDEALAEVRAWLRLPGGATQC